PARRSGSRRQPPTGTGRPRAPGCSRNCARYLRDEVVFPVFSRRDPEPLTPWAAERRKPMPAIVFRIARLSAFVLLLIFTNLTAAGIANTNIAAPDQPGPFNVGVMTFSATMTGGRTTRVQVFYPTADAVDCTMRYRI